MKEGGMEGKSEGGREGGRYMYTMYMYVYV